MASFFSLKMEKTLEGTIFGMIEKYGIQELIFQNPKNETSYFEVTNEQINSWARKILFGLKVDLKVVENKTVDIHQKI